MTTTFYWWMSIFEAVAWNGRRFVAVGSHDLDGTIMYSADGDRWEPASEIRHLRYAARRCLG